MNRVETLAQRLDEAALNVTDIVGIDADRQLTLEDAYAIQSALIARRLQRGERRVGVKMGFTSRAKMLQMGLNDVIWGRLTSGMQIAEGGTMDFNNYIHPRVEPELAFLLKRPLIGNETGPAAMAAVEAIAPALEIIDSRYVDFKFTLPEVIADNASSSGFVIGSWCDPRQDFSNLGLTVEIDGRVVEVGSTAALLGQPLRSLVAAARLSAAAGEPLQAGWVIMAGGATAAQWLAPGQYVSIAMQNMGQAGFHVGNGASL